MGEISFGGGSYKVREIILAVVATVSVIMCVVFLGLYATKNNDTLSGSKNSKNSGGVTAALQGGNATTTSSPSTSKPSSTCDTPICLETTAYVYSLVNTTVDPCTDFYSYACGNWPTRNPIEPDHRLSNVRDKIYHENELRLRRILESDKVRDVPWAAERKAKDLYKSCLDEYGRSVAGGNPFVEKVLKPMGGWYVLGNFQENSWDLLSNLEKVHVDFWTDVLFKVTAQTDYQNRDSRVITLRSGGTTLSSYYYTSPYLNRTRQDYRGYMRKVAELLVRDSGVSIPEADRNSRLDTYANDVMEVETLIANLSRSSPYNYNSFDASERIQIKDMVQLTNTTFNWVSFFAYMFDAPAVNQYTYIVVPRKTYITRMSEAINTMGSDRNRKLNNYFTWRLVLTYINELSSEYIHTARQFRNDRYGVKEFPQTWEACFDYVSDNMEDAMSHMFIEDHFGDKNKEKVYEISNYIKQAVIDGLYGDSFMDNATRKIAEDKVRAIVDKLGYPQILTNRDSVDLIYAALEVHTTDFFQNALNMNKFRKIDLNNRLHENRYLRSRWPLAAYRTSYSFIRSWNEQWIPAGLLQHPIYDYHLAHYLNFGSMGSIMAENYLNAIDRYGSRYDKNGDRINTRIGRTYTWWTNTTFNNYNTRRDCISSYFVNKTSGTYKDPDTGREVKAIISSRTARGFADRGAEEVWKIKTALNMNNKMASQYIRVKDSTAYRAWQKKNGVEPMAPSVGLSNEQMYYVAYAQTQCYVYSERLNYLYGRYSIMTPRGKVNGGVSQLQEFSDAFKCRATAVLNPSKKCPLS